MLQIRNLICFRKQRGDALLISLILTCILISVIGLAVANINIAANQGAIGAAAAQQAKWYAESKANEINVTSYSSIASVAATRATISGTSFDREVIVGTETTVNSVKTRPVTVNVYKTGQSTALSSLVLTPTSAGSVSVAPHGQQLFTSSGTFIVPSGVTQVWVSMCGGGGGGAGGYYTYYYLVITTPGSLLYASGAGANGGGGASLFEQPVTVTASQQISVTVGAGGIGGTAGGGNSVGGVGSNGDTSYFGSYLSCTGGKGGSNGTLSVIVGSTTVNGSITQTIPPKQGTGGGPGGGDASNSVTGGTIFGPGQTAYNIANVTGTPSGSGFASYGVQGNTGLSYGIGGGGALGPFKGGNGGPGMVLVRW